MPELIADELIEAAQGATGLKDFDALSFREGLEVLLADMNRLDLAGPFYDRNRKDIVAALATRLRVADYHREHPDLRGRPVERPVFVFGVPRTGTTLLSNLLAADPNRRSPLTWEIDEPVPPPKAATLYNDPRALARLEAERQLLAAHPEAGKYYRNSAIYPNECMFFMIHDFKGLLWEGRGKLPGYREWLLNADLTSTYEYHKRFLQMLQADAPGVWNLKMPSHGLWLETLLKIYPDARLVWAHRDPFAATGSFCSLMTLSHRSATGAVDMPWIAENYAWQAVEHANRIMDSRDRLGENRIIDVHYADLINDPIGAMRALYATLGDDFTAAAEAGMQTWVNDNPQDKFGKHEYKLAQYGLSVEKLAPQFERYLSRHNVAREG